MPSPGSKSQPAPYVKSSKFTPQQLDLKGFRCYRNESLCSEGTLRVENLKSNGSFNLFVSDISPDLNPPKGQTSKPLQSATPLDQAAVDKIEAVSTDASQKGRCDFAIFEDSPANKASLQAKGQ